MNLRLKLVSTFIYEADLPGCLVPPLYITQVPAAALVLQFWKENENLENRIYR